jgi:hypothetical protein
MVFSELHVQCDKVSASLCANEVDADFRSHQKDWVIYTNLL